MVPCTFNRTLLLALLGLFFGCILGLVFGLMIVLAFFVYLGIPYAFKQYLGMGMTFSSLTAGTICLAMNCGAYMSEIIRAGIQSVDSRYRKPVHHYAEGYVYSFCDRFS